MRYYGRVNFTPVSYIAYQVLGGIAVIVILAVMTVFNGIKNVVNPPHKAYTKTILASDGKNLDINMPVGTEPNSYAEQSNVQAVLANYQLEKDQQKKLDDLCNLSKVLGLTTFSSKVEIARKANYSNQEVVNYLSNKAVLGKVKFNFLSNAKKAGYGISYNGYGGHYDYASHRNIYRGYWAIIKSENWECNVKNLYDSSYPQSERGQVVCSVRNKY